MRTQIAAEVEVRVILGFFFAEKITYVLGMMVCVCFRELTVSWC